MLEIRFALIGNLIQMRRMKVIRTRKTIADKEFQQCAELQSTEVMRMPQIRFALIVIQLQMRSMKVIRNRQSIPNKEFRNSVESQSTEVRNDKMPAVQFAVIVI
jgi:hypothetical protein